MADDLDLTFTEPGAPEVHDDPDQRTRETWAPAEGVPEAGPDELAPALAEPVDPEAVRAWLVTLSKIAATIAQDHPANLLYPDRPLWEFTEGELAALVPVLTRIANRRPALAAAIERGDPLTAAMLFGTYGIRNVQQMRAANAMLQPDVHDTSDAIDPTGGTD